MREKFAAILDCRVRMEHQYPTYEKPEGQTRWNCRCTLQPRSQVYPLLAGSTDWESHELAAPAAPKGQDRSQK